MKVFGMKSDTIKIGAHSVGLLAKLIAEALSEAGGEAAYVGGIGLRGRTTIDGTFNLAVVAHRLLKKIAHADSVELSPLAASPLGEIPRISDP